MNVFLCDDQAEFMHGFANDLKGYFRNRKISFRLFLFTDGTNLLCSGIVPDIIFLDIKIGKESGLITARKIREINTRTKIVFLTAYKQYVFQSFDVDASHYLIKPVSEQKLYAVLDHLLRQLNPLKEPPIIVRSGQTTLCVSCSDLLYVEVNNKTVTLHNKNDITEFSGKLEAIETNLPARFYRCHRSFIVNMDYVVRFDKMDLHLANGESVPVSKRKYQDFTRAFLRHMKKEGLL
ncbi:DNA-binding response regulator [Lacrimispora amygdalina]|uniref:Stage 0 sporulation protein A homolog n=1 Tax=Lacrimispora amygdalina TaxID=253257 RepID=A0A3E2N5V5_9FIRM|nr:LytTR family DNA-binding domain-containing protein [Clostridium indicum]RFZ76271.1 DNA-binding response regulator [Clostridium indicum]